MKRVKLSSNKVIAQAKKKYWETFCEEEIQEYPIKNENCPNSFLSSTDKAEAFVNNFTKNILS
jgi:hypothetical protein